MTTEWDAQLAAIDGWEGVSEEDVLIPNAMYFLQVQSCEMRNAKTGKLMMTVGWAIIDNGEYDGETFYENYFPEVIPHGAKWTKRIIRALGFEPPVTALQLAPIANAIHNAAPQVQAKVTSDTSNTGDEGYTNYRVDSKTLKLLGAGERMDREPKREKAGAKAGGRSVGIADAVTQVTVGASVSFKDDDGDAQTGTVISIQGKMVHIRDSADDDDSNPWKVPVTKVTVTGGEPEADEPAEPDDLDELDRAGLKTIIEEEGLGITVYRGWDEDKIRGAIRDVRPDPDPEEPVEPDEPTEPGEPDEPVEPGTEGEPEEPTEPDDDPVPLDDLIAIGQAHGMNIGDKDEPEAIVKKLTNRTWDRSKLTEDEADKLNGIGCKFGTPAAKPKAAQAAKKRGGTVKRTVAKKKKGAKKKGKR